VRTVDDETSPEATRRALRDAAAGVAPAALMARAGHSDFKTTQGYIDLAGETFREEAELLEERLFGQKSRQK
jgi:hypothetical protein